LTPCGSSDGAACYIMFQVRRENHAMVRSARAITR
jgi:hypothetical protein